VKRLPAPGPYAITPDWDDTDRLVARAAEIIAGGAVMLQYRHKQADVDLRLRQARRLKQLCATMKVPFIINDSVQLCLEADADGVHLGRDNTPIAAARARLGPDRIIGATCYGDAERAEAAARDGADYVAFGGFFRSSRKDYAPTTPHDILTDARQRQPLPIAVIGGMSSDNCQPLIERGARWIAAIGSLFDAPDSRAATRDMARLFDPPSQDATL